MELLKNFGVEPVLFIAQVVNFLIIFYVLKRFMFKPVLEMLKTRESTIKKGLSDAEEARLLLEQAAEKEREVLKKAQSDAKALILDAKKQSEDMITASEQKTREQVEKMLKEAREQISFETKEAEKRLAAGISELAVKFIEQSVKELFTDKDQDLVMDKALKNMKKKAN